MFIYILYSYSKMDVIIYGDENQQLILVIETSQT